MRTIVVAIQERKQRYGRLPFFEYLRDEGLEARQRLAYYPCMAPVMLGLVDASRSLRQEPAESELQAALNRRASEHERRWWAYLEDLGALGLDVERRGSEWMRLLWGEETRVGRMLVHRLVARVEGASAVERVAVLEAAEAAGRVLSEQTARLAERHRARTGVELRFSGKLHTELEGEVAAARVRMALVELGEEARISAVKRVGEVFQLFEAWTGELLAYAKAHPLPRMEEGAGVQLALLPSAGSPRGPLMRA